VDPPKHGAAADSAAGGSGAGRYAPSPSGDLHLGNLRTAVLAHAFARRSGREFLLRVDDLDPQRSRADVAERQLADLGSLGLRWDRAPEWQSRNYERYEAALADLTARGLTYECFCSRREILDAPRAPHAPPGAYPGTCRFLTPDERERKRAELPPNKVPAIRVLAQPAEAGEGEAYAVTHTVFDLVQGEFEGVVDDLVLRRGDGAWAYNLAVVVDDAAAGIDQVVRGADLLDSAPRQAWLAGLLGLPAVEYAHVPLAVAAGGERLAKRDGGHTLAELRERGIPVERVLEAFAESVGVSASASTSVEGILDAITAELDPEVLSPGGEFGEPWIVPEFA